MRCIKDMTMVGINIVSSLMSAASRGDIEISILRLWSHGTCDYNLINDSFNVQIDQ